MAQDAKHDALPDWLIATAGELDFSEVRDSTAITALLEISESCLKLERKPAARRFREKAVARADRNERRSGYMTLVTHAINIGRLELAEQYANKSPLKDSNLDKIAVARYRLGEQDAVKGYPRAEQDLHSALQLANAYVAAGEYDKAEAFVTDIKISEENDPRAVTSITFRNIANRCREHGELDRAKFYIDKALAVGGRLYYTGYSIQVSHRSNPRKADRGSRSIRATGCQLSRSPGT